ncbi:glycosyltransferase family 4 protein [Hyphomicrobium sp. 99]|uniref:glycosyltransferase family 4 protein n=1 Tax=Hyphomicrobium sp. 99 TaxID=1163419 RepID=UPI0005F7FE87|nr:glycosyltransferase family 4 protein [Hyphomicrobium sp. 99]
MLDRAPLRFAVLQPGARLHYALPAVLQRAGMLERLYTDFCVDTGPLRHLEQLWPLAYRPAPVRRMLGRRLPAEIPRAKVREARAAVVRESAAKIFAKDGANSAASLLEVARKENFGGANAIYTVLVNEDIEICREAKLHGCKIVHEAMIGPDVGLWLNEEHKRFPGRRQNGNSIDRINAGRERDRLKYEIADLIIAPSDFVKKAVIALGADPARVAIVPYGIDESWLQTETMPERGRALFVGSVSFRKGNHYLAEAARILMKKGVDCDVRVVGPVDRQILNDSLFHGPSYVGQIPRAEVRKEFGAADVFVLPTLCDSFALVHLEAMACGVPVITTPNCGSVVRNGIDGLIVPIRSATAIAEAIERIVTDRNLRENMSRNARERAASFTLKQYEDRLVGAISRVQAND